MKPRWLALALLGGSLFAGQARAGNVSIGVAIGAPPPVPYWGYYAPPPMPGPGYLWVGGYWYPQGGRYAWRNGYWARPPWPGAYWNTPRYYGGRYYGGYWGRGDRDRDGIPNRWDRYDNRFRGGWDRDRDGIPNRYDRFDNRRGWYR